MDGYIRVWVPWQNNAEGGCSAHTPRDISHTNQTNRTEAAIHIREDG